MVGATRGFRASKWALGGILNPELSKPLQEELDVLKSYVVLVDVAAVETRGGFPIIIESFRA